MQFIRQRVFPASMFSGHRRAYSYSKREQPEPRFHLKVILALLVVCLFAFYILFHSHTPPPLPPAAIRRGTAKTARHRRDPLQDALRQMFPSKRTATTDFDLIRRSEQAAEQAAAGHVYTNVDPKQVCVLASDSRPLIFNGTANDFWTASSLLQYAWTRLHGYSYRRPPLDWPNGYHHTWGKVPIILDTVEACQWTVFFDSDSHPAKLHWSLDDMRTEWHFHDDASILLALDPPVIEVTHNATNTGFWVVQRTPTALKALKDLMDCPEKDPACAVYKKKWAHEQSAFSEFIRPRLVEWEDFIIAPCNDANGYAAYEHCKGRIIQHRWFNKAQAIVEIKALLADAALSMINDAMAGEELLELPYGELGRLPFEEEEPQEER